jgi:hypothetical protein
MRWNLLAIILILCSLRLVNTEPGWQVHLLLGSAVIILLIQLFSVRKIAP